MFRLRWACVSIAILLVVQFAPAKVALATEAENEIREKLQQHVSFEFECEPLGNVLKFIAEITGINFQVDTNALKELGKKTCKNRRMKTNTIFVTVNVEDVTLESALSHILSKHGLGFYIEGDNIFVTSMEKVRKETT